MTLTVLKSTGHIYYKMLLHWNVSAFFLLFIDWGISLGRKISHPLVVKDLPANAGDARDTGSISGLGRSPREGMATHSSILAWKIPWTEESGGLQSRGSQTVRYNCLTECSLTD